MVRPNFEKAWQAFMDVKLSVADVGKKLGGNVQRNIDAGIFQNACPIRMSYVLNQIGIPVPKNKGYTVVSDAQKAYYIFRVKEMISFLQATFGKPDKIAKSPTPNDFVGLQGILVITGKGWTNAVGHVTLWNGEGCSDVCHLMNDPENGSFVPDEARLWRLS